MSNHNPYWTDERIEKLKKYWADGLSAGQIAARLGGGVSRNAVLGRIHRMRNQAGTVLRKKVEKKALAPRPSKADKIIKLPVLKSVQLPPPPVHLPEPTPLNVTLVELGSRDCRWPISGEKEHMLFCGHDVTSGSSYCLCHHNRSINLKYRADRSIAELVKRVA